MVDNGSGAAPSLCACVRRLQLGQPSMFNQFVAHEHLVTDPSCVLRYTNFVEIMCPFFHVRHVGCANGRRLFRVVWPSAWIKL